LEAELANNDFEDNDASAKELKKLIKDWGVSHATLEEVFMKVTGKKE
jgi:hypothetical protein